MLTRVKRRHSQATKGQIRRPRLAPAGQGTVIAVAGEGSPSSRPTGSAGPRIVIVADWAYNPRKQPTMPKTAAEKLGIRPGSTATIINAEPDTPPLGEMPEGVTVGQKPGRGVPDVLVLFAHSIAQLHRDAPGLLAPLTDATKVWIAYRKSGVSDLSRDVLMPALTGIGWHGVSLVSLDQTWTAARFRRLEHIGR